MEMEMELSCDGVAMATTLWLMVLMEGKTSGSL